MQASATPTETGRPSRLTCYEVKLPGASLGTVTCRAGVPAALRRPAGRSRSAKKDRLEIRAGYPPVPIGYK